MALINCPECNKEISDKAGACPSCGHPIEKNVATEQEANSNIKICPTCRSKNTQTIKMMCLAGSSSADSTAVGVTTDLKLGVAKINTNSQSNLAAMYDIGKEINTAPIIFLAIVSVPILLAGLATSTFPIIFIGGVFSVFSVYTWSNEVAANNTRNSKMEKYTHGWICHACGKTWIP